MVTTSASVNNFTLSNRADGLSVPAALSVTAILSVPALAPVLAELKDKDQITGVPVISESVLNSGR